MRGQQMCYAVSLIVLMTVALAAAQAADPPAPPEDNDRRPPFTVSRETTRLTEPLLPDGRVDYLGAVNVQMSRGVTPQTNAAVELIAVLGQDYLPESEAAREILRQMGLDGYPNGGPVLVSMCRYAQAAAGQEPPQDADPDDAWWDGDDQGGDLLRRLHQQLDYAYTAPWQPQERPELARWLEVNDAALDRVVRGLQRPHFYLPLHRGESSLINLEVVSYARHRHLAEVLAARAMLRAGQGRHDAAIEDLKALHRLARHTARPVMAISNLVAAAIDSVASGAAIQLATADHLPAPEAGAMARQMLALPALPTMIDAMDTLERFWILDHLQAIAVGAEGPDHDLPPTLRREEVDWDQVMQVVNRHYDHVVQWMRAAGEAPGRAGSQPAEAPVSADRNALEGSPGVERIERWLAEQGDQGLHTQRMLRHVGTHLMHLDSHSRRLFDFERQVTARRRLAALALALSAYRQRNDAFPDALDALVPDYLPAVPTDPFTAQPLIYRTTDDGYVLYSTGPSGRDDGGRTREDRSDADDIVVRVPPLPIEDAAGGADGAGGQCGPAGCCAD